MGDQGMAYAPQADEPEAIGGAGGGLRGGALNNVQRRFLRAGRILVAGAWLVLTNTNIGNHGRGANAEHAVVGLALLLLGVFLILLSPVADQFPGAARAGAAVADAVLFFAPGN
ncbi:unnamed protein product [Urochloa humidicola]